MGLSNALSSEAGSLSCCCNPHRFLQPEVLRLYFPCWNPDLCDLSCSPVVPPGSSASKCGTTWSSLPWLPNSAPPTCLGECFFFNCLVVGLPHSLIFLAVMVTFFKLLFSFFWLCEEAKCLYLCLHLGQK